MAQSQFAAYGRIGALRLHALNDSRELTKPARDAWLGKFRQEVIAAAATRGQTLDEPEIERRAGLLRRAHMSELSLLAAKATRRRSKARDRRRVTI